MNSKQRRFRLCLITNSSGEVPQHLNIFHQKQANDVTVQDREKARQVFHELYLEGVIISGASANAIGDGLMSWPHYMLTDYGRQVLASPEYQPHDLSGYLVKLKQQIPPIDPDVIRYLEESLQCFQRGTLLASAVMLGCAAEKAALLLIDAFGNAIGDAAKMKQYQKETAFWMISRKYEALWKRLEPLAGGLPKELGEDLHTILDRVFDLIRSTRNVAGHPTGKSVERDTMRANFIVFPMYCGRVYGLIDYFGKNPV